MVGYVLLVSTTHGTPQICFRNQQMTLSDLETIQGILDNSLNFHWTLDGLQFTVFNWCDYFAINEDLVFPVFFHSFRHESVLRHEDYNYLTLVYQMAEAE